MSVGFRVTRRDVGIVYWTGRLRFAEAGQIARRFAMDERNAYRRLRGLVHLGLVDRSRIFHARPGAYTATRAGLGAAGLTLPPPRVDIRTYEHDRTAAAVMIELEREFGTAALLTERELRTLETANPARARYAVRRGSEVTRRGLHFPDLAVALGDGRSLAVEVELTAKGRGRLDSIVRAYVRARHIETVRYYAAPAALTGVQRAVARAGAERLFDIRLWRDDDRLRGADPTARAA